MFKFLRIVDRSIATSRQAQERKVLTEKGGGAATFRSKCSFNATFQRDLGSVNNTSSPLGINIRALWLEILSHVGSDDIPGNIGVDPQLI